MGFMDKLTDFAKNAGDAAQDFAKNAGDKAQELAKAAQEKAAYMKELQRLKTSIKEQEGIVTMTKLAIAEAVLENRDLYDNEAVKALCERFDGANEQIAGLKGQIEALRASAKDPEMEQEVTKAIEEIDIQNAIDIPVAQAEENAAEASVASETPKEDAGC